MRAGQRVQLTARAPFARTSTLVTLYVAPYIAPMCGRVVQASEPLRYTFVDGLSLPDSRTRPPSYNVAPSQELYVIRHNHKTGHTLDLLRWGLIPHGCKDPTGGRKPINARAESVASLPTFRAAYAKRRCIIPVESFFEWRAIKGARAKQPYAVAMKDRTPFAIAGLWENWRHPQSGEWIRTFAIITVPANELVAQIHDRMPLILPKSAYERWLGVEPDPHDLLTPFAVERMKCGRSRRG
jgi:putative SOS response-associated peptidase YedK